MFDSNAKPERSWQKIVADARKEQNPEKLAELSKELERALDQRSKVLHPRFNPPMKPCKQKKTG